ncbi:MAG: phytoene/squalene synthase family protein [Bacteroidetes bacterium]|nr:phytoene/squalene synthase family protein [Bacteroidota bacterium]MBL0137923.1 phytoene/squalene synthase family protein [Bacteroidota bacterium]
MNMELYNQISYKAGKVITKDYSTSFSLGIRMLDRKFHDPIYAIYAFVRVADEIVDSFYQCDQAAILRKFIEATDDALKCRLSTNPVLHAFQDVVHRYSIERPLIDAFLHSMEMDLSEKKHEENSYSEYIYGSAEVVGLMCLRVFCENDADLYDRLLGPARKLGAAFQKVNFLRDMKSDYSDRGRIYFPGIDFEKFDNESKKLIEADIQKDFDDSLEGIRALPQGSRLGVTIAYIYYRALFRKIKMASAATVQQQRIRVPDSQKLFLLLKTWFRYKLNLI